MTVAIVARGALWTRGRPVSLLDMLKLQLGPLLTCATGLATMRTMTDVSQNLAPQAGNNVLEYAAAVDLANHLARVITEARRLGLNYTADGAQRALDTLRQGNVTHARCRAMLIGVEERLQDEGFRRSFFAIDPVAETYFPVPGQPLLGAHVAAAFPSADYDIDEAGACFALERYTGAVMHAMRAMEPVLRALALEVGVTPGANWNKVLNEIEAAIRKPEQRRTPADETWLNGLAAHFRFIKNGFRNSAMHAHSRYSENEARQVLDHARDFMRDAATRLRERDPEDC